MKGKNTDMLCIADKQRITLSRVVRSIMCFILILVLQMPSVYAASGMLPQTFTKAITGEEAEVEINADVFQRLIAMDVRSGQIVYQKEAAQSYAPSGSAVTLMTAFIALSELNADEVITVTQEYLEDEVIDVSVGLEAGDQVTVRDLIACMILDGAQDCAVVLAKHIAGSTDMFVQRMNETAQSLLMKDTVYTNVTGIYDEEQKTSVQDILRLVYAIRQCDQGEEIFTAGQFVTSAESNSLPEIVDNRVTLLLPEHESHDTRVMAGYGGGSSQQEGFNTAILAQTNDLELIVVASSARSERRVYTELSEIIDQLDEQFQTVDLSTVVQIAVAEVVPVKEGYRYEWSFPEAYLTGTHDWTADSQKITCVWKSMADPVAVGEEFGKLSVLYENEEVADISVICTEIPVAEEPEEQKPSEQQPMEEPVQLPEKESIVTEVPEDYKPYERTFYDRFGWLLWSLAAVIGGFGLVVVCELIAKRFN